MSKRPVKSVRASRRVGRRSFPEEFKRDAVQMLLDGHTAPSVVERLGLSSAEQQGLSGMANRQMRNWNGIHVGDIRVVGL